MLRRLYVLSVPGSRHVGWYPLANLVMDWILLRAIRMCLTGRVTWRGTAYGPRRRPGGRRGVGDKDGGMIRSKAIVRRPKP